MNKLKYLSLLLFAVCLLVGCGNSHRQDFNRLLVELAGADQTIDDQDWQRIADYLDRNKAHFKKFYDRDKLDADDVREYIVDFFSHRRPSKMVKFTNYSQKPLNFRIYLERSGSMTAYSSPQGDGSFDAAIMALRNNLPGKSTVEDIGTQGYTDFHAIFDNLLNKTRKDQISILVTDMIYSVKDMQGVNPQKIFNDMQGMINAVFKDEVERKAMLVVKMEGSYNGIYYSYDNSKQDFQGKRPYYIIVVGSNENMARLTKDPKLRAFADFQHLRGYQNMYLYQAEDFYSPYYSLLLNNQDIRGRFHPKRGQAERVTEIEGVKPDPDSGDIQLALAVDLSGMLIDDTYLTDIRNYEVEARDEIKIKSIRPITRSDQSPAEQKYLKHATHIFILSLGALSQSQEVDIKLINRLPAWVAQSSSDDDRHVDSRSTFGLRYLMEGIYDSYNRMSDGEPEYFDIELDLDR